MTIGPTPTNILLGEPVRLFSQKVGLCEWYLDGGQVVHQNPDGSFMVAWYLPGPKHVVLARVSPLNGQRAVDERTIVVT